jgi:hypothetical protein
MNGKGIFCTFVTEPLSIKNRKYTGTTFIGKLNYQTVDAALRRLQKFSGAGA